MRLARDDDPVVAPVVRRAQHLLTDPSEITNDEAVQERVRRYLETDPHLSADYGTLPRHDFERIVAS